MDLTVTLKGQRRDLTLKNPVLTASGTFGSGLEFAPYGDLAALGGIVVKGLYLRPRQGNAQPRIVETTAGMLNAVGLQNDGVESFLAFKLPHLPWRETAIIANLYATSPEEFRELAARLNSEPGVAALEVNVSCPNVAAGGALFGQDPKLAAAVTRAVREGAPDKHVMVKLSPNVTDIALMARSVEDAGADSISCINTLLGMAVDLPRRRPALANIVGGLSGPAIKPVALRCVWQAARAVSIPVVGLGGIVSADDALEFLLVGAQAVQVGTANFLRPDAAFAIVEDLPAACERAGAASPRELVGALVTDRDGPA
ncbi:dihydroorotate dehydrogenase [uncultured Desulfovibrio sp.]|uniref:dihydroorotate dehydrogenase n=1 Tax=uncultured Desulfovibrio sp. TaxID=167968 RepID=UPI0026249E3E|nr:dihydroorotate dehydrogenase [uncultured Desulfovibrio sp.]